MAKPEIRLKGFKGEWENKSLGELSKGFSYGINAAAKPFDGVKTSAKLCHFLIRHGQIN